MIQQTTVVQGDYSVTAQDSVPLREEQTQKRREFLAIAGTIEFDDDWDYRKLRGK